MTLEHILPLLLSIADDRGCIIDYTALQAWPDGALDHAARTGLLREAACGLTAPCPSCPDGHVEEVHSTLGPDGRQRHFIICDEAGRVEVTRDMCRGWEMDPDGLAAVVARALDLRGHPKDVAPDRLWRLGRIPWRGKTREVVLARQLGDSDAASVIAHVGAGGRSIVLVPTRAPDERLWAGRVPAVIPLASLLSVVNGEIAIDAVAFMEMIEIADEVAEAGSKVPTDPEVKKQIVRRQVKAEIKSHLEDDVLTDAVKTQGSVRKAATYLTELLGRKVSKDQVQRAVNRAGGRERLMESDDSASVPRTVASQRRDRATKAERYRK